MCGGGRIIHSSLQFQRKKQGEKTFIDEGLKESWGREREGEREMQRESKETEKEKKFQMGVHHCIINFGFFSSLSPHPFSLSFPPLIPSFRVLHLILLHRE